MEDEPIIDEPDYLALVNELKSLHKLRAEEAVAQEKYETVMQKFQEDNAETIIKIKTIKEAKLKARETIKKLGGDEFRITGKKHLIGGIAIKMMKKLEYDPDAALIWAKDHDLALSLDKRRFEQLAKTENIDFVKIVETPQVTIPSIIKFI